MGFLGFWVKIKTPDLAPPSPPSPRTKRRALLREPRARFFAAQNPGKLLCSPSSLLLLSLRCRTRGLFFLQVMDMQRAGPLSWDKHLVLPGGGAEPPVRLLSLTSFSAGDLVPRPCMSSSYSCASCRLCLLRARVFECPRAHLLSSAPRLAPLIPAGPSVSKEIRR